MKSKSFGNKRKTKTITFCSGKGGVGKSVITANMAAALSDNGSSVLVFDSVDGLPNQHIIFGVEPPIRLSSVMSGKVDAESALFRVRENLSLIVDSPLEISEFEESVLNLDDILSELKSSDKHEYIFIDTKSGLNEQLISFCLMSDLIVIMITDEPTSLLDAYGLIKILINFTPSKNIVILVNNVIDSEDADEVSQKLNLATGKFLNTQLDLLGFIPYSRNIRLSIQSQELLIDKYNFDESSNAIRNIVNVIEKKYFRFNNLDTVNSNENEGS
ncbi:MAG: AAA family ATPase [Candidatus Kapabacteria bacterium]|jgi:flagellar biosynthesis protein FlhG|nr:AAA family ATPase [Candidatus Kapabacteria bacterium]